MSSSTPRILEGVFAIHKPPSISSAQVIRNLQDAFLPSSLFAPLIGDQKARRDQESRFQRKRRREKAIRLKIGHGGTLDPLATGVLIIGVGRGTKHLQGFLGCTKSYTANVLFGAATDTYDIVGKVLSKAPYEHVTQETVESALGQFRGVGMQTPPIYSALNQDGKRLYEYAREGKAPPREIQQRPVTVERLELVRWLGKEHVFRWPTQVAPEAERTVAGKVLGLTDSGVQQEGQGSAVGQSREIAQDISVGEKRKRGEELETKGTGVSKKRKENESSSENPQQPDAATTVASENPAQDLPAQQEEPMSIPPAVKLDMTVTSGFYVRSLCHDLGKAVGSHGLMASLVRTRQGEYTLGQNVLEYDDLELGEDVWGPKLKAMLEAWLEQNPAETQMQETRKDSKMGPNSGQVRRRRNSSSEPDG